MMRRTAGGGDTMRKGEEGRELLDCGDSAFDGELERDMLGERAEECGGDEGGG